MYIIKFYICFTSMFHTIFNTNSTPKKQTSTVATFSASTFTSNSYITKFKSRQYCLILKTSNIIFFIIRKYLNIILFWQFLFNFFLYFFSNFVSFFFSFIIFFSFLFLFRFFFNDIYNRRCFNRVSNTFFNNRTTFKS